MKSEKTEKDLRCSEDTAKKFRSSYFANWERVSTLPKSNGKVSKNISCKTDYKSLISGESPIRKKKQTKKTLKMASIIFMLLILICWIFIVTLMNVQAIELGNDCVDTASIDVMILTALAGGISCILIYIFAFSFDEFLKDALTVSIVTLLLILLVFIIF